MLEQKVLSNQMPIAIKDSKIDITSEKLTKELAKGFTNYLKGGEFIFLFGEMGVGKTTLIKALSSSLGVTDIVSSPTFSLVNEYNCNGDYKIYHFDFYRLKNDLSAYDIGFEEYMSTEDYCFIEWSEKILDLLPNNVVKLYLSLNKNERVINVNCKNE